MIYLDYNNRVLDSTIVKDNTFKFETKLPDTIIKLWLHNKSFLITEHFGQKINQCRLMLLKLILEMQK
ncbi:hypothetical protein [Postechiella marina]|uniref:hypothetical protein n=1 Tax=Postechiella marina TaxID=943941 RepID=UPI0031D32A29